MISDGLLRTVYTNIKKNKDIKIAVISAYKWMTKEKNEQSFVTSKYIYNSCMTIGNRFIAFIKFRFVVQLVKSV